MTSLIALLDSHFTQVLIRLQRPRYHVIVTVALLLLCCDLHLTLLLLERVIGDSLLLRRIHDSHLRLIPFLHGHGRDGGPSRPILQHG